VAVPRSTRWYTMLRRRAIVLVTCGACALALGAVLLGAARPAAGLRGGLRSAAAFRSTAVDQGGGAETACSDAVRAIDPKLFSPGAYVSFPPTRGDQHETVFLDAGHGG